jgi:hypothetical protein
MSVCGPSSSLLGCGHARSLVSFPLALLDLAAAKVGPKQIGKALARLVFRRAKTARPVRFFNLVHVALRGRERLPPLIGHALSGRCFVPPILQPSAALQALHSQDVLYSPSAVKARLSTIMSNSPGAARLLASPAA